ncbi:hypothetical protein [Nonomuraea sp. NPDC049784]|uniref:hypothetical protein n=1 Tax=Nonomuraea sp. NPDC049784 TaxID=3154361 RepID=UPI0033C400E1
MRSYKTEVRKNTSGKVTFYRVRWSTTGKERKKTFQKSAQADAFRSSPVTAAHEEKRSI